MQDSLPADPWLCLGYDGGPRLTTLPAPPPPPYDGAWPSMLITKASRKYGCTIQVQSAQPKAKIYAHIEPAPPLGNFSQMTNNSNQEMVLKDVRSATPRKKLTNGERRDICRLAEKQPEWTQEQIGAEFNVERRYEVTMKDLESGKLTISSTVSKILKESDKWKALPEHEDVNPEKPTMVQLPNVERATLSWLRRRQRGRQPITDEDLREQISKFMTTWMESFKTKYLRESSPPSNWAECAVETGFCPCEALHILTDMTHILASNPTPVTNVNMYTMQTDQSGGDAFPPSVLRESTWETEIYDTTECVDADGEELFSEIPGCLSLTTV